MRACGVKSVGGYFHTNEVPAAHTAWAIETRTEAKKNKIQQKPHLIAGKTHYFKAKSRPGKKLLISVK